MSLSLNFVWACSKKPYKNLINKKGLEKLSRKQQTFFGNVFKIRCLYIFKGDVWVFWGEMMLT